MILAVLAVLVQVLAFTAFWVLLRPCATMLQATRFRHRLGIPIDSYVVVGKMVF
jgi:hypothetical protein